MARYTLGLDLGPSSIGWALTDEASAQIIDLGVRVFPEGVDNFDTKKERSRNEDRRIARGMRRQIARRSRRKCKLRNALTDIGMFPTNPIKREALFRHNPYELRARALDEKLAPDQIGRVLLHLNQHRGFLSNRKKDRGDKEVKGRLQEISELAEDIERSGARTLGEYLSRKCESFDHAHRADNDHVRNRHTRRDLLEEEFAHIWKAQAKHHPQLLTDRLRYGALGKGSYPCRPRKKPKGMSDLESFGLHGMIFFQRRMYWPKSVIGLCELEPKERRCPRADRHAQGFRLLQEVNNLRYIDPDLHEERSLNTEERSLLLDFLSTRQKATFDEIRKKLGFLEAVKFNLERGKRSSLKGMVVDWMVAKAVGKRWHKRPEDEKDAIVRLLLDNEGEDDAVCEKLVSDFDFTSDEAETVLGVDFPTGYANLSLKAIDKLLPHLQGGLVYQSVSDPKQSALHAAGYTRRDELHRRLFDRLPDPARMNPRDCPIGDIPNPVVKRSLVELRKVVNAILREYGKPDAVHVEMARDVRMGPKARSEYNVRIREREAQCNWAADEIREYSQKYPDQGVRVNRESILRFLLWVEQNRECLYCQRAISQQQLFGGEIDVDHILPYSRCLDDSQANKVVAHRRCNHDKGQRTPYEWLAASDPRRYERICQHAASLMKQALLPYGKYRKFLQKELELDTFIARQLTDTGYIARATAEYLRLLFDQPHTVLGLKGQQTAELRRQWGLNSVLRHDDLDLKNREDHRHHAVDAVVVALTNRRRLQQLAKATVEVQAVDRETGEVQHRQQYTGDRFDEPWEGFRRDVEQAVNRINVAHRPNRKTGCALHKDNPFGHVWHSRLEADGPVWVKRKPLADLSASEICGIRDDAIRRIVIQQLLQNGIRIATLKPKRGRPKVFFEDVETGLPTDATHALGDIHMPSGVPIKKVRLLIKNQTIKPIRTGAAEKSDDNTRVAYVEPDEVHHVCVFQWKDGASIRREGVFVHQLEVMKRLSRQRQHLSELQRQWRSLGATAYEIRRRNAAAMRQIAREHPIVQRVSSKHEREPATRIPPDAEFLFSLSTGDMVLVEMDGRERLKVVSTLVSTQGRIHLVDARDARKKRDDIGTTPNSLVERYKARKVIVDPIGRIRWAND